MSRNKYAIGTVIGAALLGLTKSSLLGSKNDGIIVRSVDELIRHANDRILAWRVWAVVLAGQQLTSIPPEIFKLMNLEVLNLTRNQLTTLPPEIGKFTDLRILNLDENQLTTLPPEIGNLKNLERLYLNENQLTTLPPEIGKLKNLENLLLYRNPKFYMNPEQLHQLILNGADKEIQRVIVEANVIPTISNVRLR